MVTTQLAHGSPSLNQLVGRGPGRGRRFEELFFGVNVDYDWFSAPPEHASFPDSFRQCLLHQPSRWNPLNPPTRFGWNLRYWAAKYLPASWQKHFGLYVSLGTPLDYWHHVDGFFYLGDPLTDEDWYEFRRRVTVDLASYDKRRDGRETSANLLISPETFCYDGLKKMGRCVAGYLTGKIGVQDLRTLPYTWVSLQD